MTCDEYRTDYLEGDPAPETTAHMATCADCRRALPELNEIAELLADRSMWAFPSPELEDAVVSSIIEDTTEPVTPRPRTHRTSMRWGALAAAAAVVAVGVIVGSLGPGRPDWQIDVPGTERAPQASAFVEGWDTPSGTRLRVTMDGLPPAPEGHVYELWLTREREHVSAGSFVQADGLEMQIGVRQRDYPRVWITLETLDGDPSPNWDQNLIDTGA